MLPAYAGSVAASIGTQGHAAASLHFSESLNKGNCPAIVSRDPGNL